MKSEKEFEIDIKSASAQENDLMAYNYVIKNFLPNLKEIDSLEEFNFKKQNNIIPKALIPKILLYTYNVDKQKIESVMYVLRNGYDQIEIFEGKIISYRRALIFFSGAGCCGGTSGIKDDQSYENQLRVMEYNPNTLEKTFSHHRLLDGKWVKTDLKTNDIVQIDIEQESCGLPDSFKDKLPEVFSCNCKKEDKRAKIYFTAFYTNTSKGKLIKFAVIDQ